jgi:hypothetical protein
MASHVSSSTSMAHSLPKYYKFPPHDLHIDKGNNHVTSPRSKASQSSSIHSKQQSTKADIGKREITFSDMHPEIVKLDEKKSYYEYFLNIRSDVSECRKESEEFFKNKYPHLF